LRKQKILIMESKVCPKCKVEKPITKFETIHGKKENGRHNECKECCYEDLKKTVLKKYGNHNWEKCLFNNFKDRIRNRTRQAFRTIKLNKPCKTENLLGCDWMCAKNHIESFFTNDLNWDNFHQWHIDHIIPLCSAKTKDDLIPLCHYTNLQPLMAFDNLSKGSKYIGKIYKTKK
jgi:hypothetical protein